MNTSQNFFSDTKQALKNYLKNRMLLLKLQAVNSISKLVATLISLVLIAFLSFFIVVFLSITAGYYFASLTGSYVWGFAIVTGIYFLLLLIVLMLKKNVIQKSAGQMIIKTFLNKRKDSDVSK